MRTAAHLKPGEKAIVHSFSDDYLSIKLMEMGVLPGTEIEFQYAAPFGDPLCFRVSGYKLSLRINEAHTISLN